MTAAAPTAATPGAGHLSTYSTVAIVFHWLIAALILTNIVLAWYFTRLKGEAQFGPAGLHKSIGITVLLLTLLRIGWRFTSRPPPLPATMKTWEVWAARTTHFVFYLLMLGLPLSGWAMTSASVHLSAHPTTFFGLFRWPAIPFGKLGMDSDQIFDARKLFGATHTILGWVAYATIALHVAAALKHQLIDRDDVMARMIPFMRGRGAA
jgi:cytochrome b561